MLVDKTKYLLKVASGKEPSEAVKAKLEEDYVEARDELLKNTTLSEYIPAVLNSTVSLDGFRLNMTEHGSYANRRAVIDEGFKEIEHILENWDKKTVVPGDFELSQEQITKQIREHFSGKDSKLQNIYGEFTQTQKQLGSGGTSIVKAFELEDIAGKKSGYAFKFLAENIYDNKEGRAYKRFKQAHLNISCIQHTGAILPQVHIDTLKIAEDLVVPYVMMPIADMTLKKYVTDLKKSYELTFEKIDEILEELCERIETIHKKDIIHRDIKPENIFIHDGNIVLGDFDIAKFSDDTAKLIETKDGERLANFNCSAPEQSSKAFDEITAAADWYALGQTLHWIITGDYKRGISPIDYSDYGDTFVKYQNVVSKLLSDDPDERQTPVRK